ncbi:EF-hand domain-containing protein D2-like [Phyllostomus discolor]|uniref:EF-hand domain-containing protein D2-like n=1 Tax=Phyllostomus discolor TaxID=89673 RepID=A0A7E6EFA7_9CHIR|nr:EF-hand domain-containing protein D2-like [Phyllostomus discolor]
MVKRADEDFGSKPIFQKFLLIFCEAAARSCRTRAACAGPPPRDQRLTKGIKGPQSSFEAEVQAISVLSSLEEEIKEEQEERTEEVGEMKLWKVALKEL